MNKKILIFSAAPTYEHPSLCPFVLQRIIELQKQGYEVNLVQGGFVEFYKENQKGNFIRKLKNLVKFLISKNKLLTYSTEKYSYSYFNKLSFFNYKQFYKWYKKQKYDLINGHFLWFTERLPEFKKLFNIPYVITVHGSDLHEITSYDSMAINNAMNILNNADHCIFISKYLLNYARSLGYSKNNCSVIYNGVDKMIFKYNPESDIKKTSDNIILGFVGHVTFVKRADILPLVLKLLHKKLPSAKLMIVGCGDGDLLPYLKAQTCKYNLTNYVDFIPAVPPEEVGEYMKKFDVLLFPSRNDGFGCVAIEAQSCGVGVVAADNGGIAEAVGKNGICIPESENFIQDFSDSIIKWLNTEHNSKEIDFSINEEVPLEF